MNLTEILLKHRDSRNNDNLTTCACPRNINPRSDPQSPTQPKSGMYN